MPLDDVPDYKCAESMRCLGHHLAGNSTISADFRATVRGIWASYWRNCGQGLQRANESAQANFMNASLRSIACFRWSRWPWQKAYADQLDSLQRHLVNCIRPVRPLPGEAAQAFFVRRHTACSQIAHRWGQWGQQWARSNVSWDAHIVRAHDPNNWGLPLRNYHGERWLNRKRFEHSRQNHWGRTGTRCFAGRPATRWHEGVRAACAVINV